LAGLVVIRLPWRARRCDLAGEGVVPPAPGGLTSGPRVPLPPAPRSSPSRPAASARPPPGRPDRGRVDPPRRGDDARGV